VDFDPGAGTALKTSVDNANFSGDAYVAQVTPGGGLGYFVSVGSVAGREDGFGIAVDPSGSAYVVGELQGSASIRQADGSVAATLTSSGNFDAYALRLTPAGGLLWAKEWGSAGADSATEIAFDGPSNAIYLTGGYTGTVTFGPGTSLSSAGGSSDVFVMRLGTDGSFGWAVGMGGGDFDLGHDISVNGIGDVFTAGRYAGTADFDPGPGVSNLTSAGNTDGFLSRLTQNRAPVAADDAYSTDEDTPVTVPAPGLLGNDTDPDGDPLTATLVTGPAHGSVALNSNGALTYTPLPNFNGTDFFTYRASDGALASNVASVTVTVRPVNDAPAAAADAYSTDEDTPLTVAAPGVLGNDTDVDGDPLTALLVTGPARGTLALNSNGSFTYSPALNFNGTDTFTYRASDGSLSSGVATVFLTVRPVNDAPVAPDDAYSTDEDTPVTVPAPGVLGNDSDAEGDALTAALVSGPSNGTLALNSNGSFVYTPAPDFNGTDFFIYRASDGSLASNLAAVTITVRPVNDAPAAANQTFSVPENSANGTPVGVFQASDVEGDALTYAFVSGNTGGAFAIDPATGRITVANGSLLDFETRPQYVLTVSATDPSGLSAQATATINLTDVIETVPVAIDIKPGDPSNTINIKSKGTIEVAIFSAPTFDARRIDVGSLRFGRTGNEDSLSRTPHGDPRFRYEDLNGDGRLDLVAQFETERTGFIVGDVLGRLKGQTIDGQLFAGSDLVLIRRPGN
jgi:hypothetical protein